MERQISSFPCRCYLSLLPREEVGMFIVPTTSHLPCAIINGWRKWPRSMAALTWSTPPVNLCCINVQGLCRGSSSYQTVWELQLTGRTSQGAVSSGSTILSNIPQVPWVWLLQSKSLRPRQGHSVTPAGRYSISSHWKDLLSRTVPFSLHLIRNLTGSGHHRLV